ncbi:unnamed protein product [Peniophora sp. CBMAI 1063]|nr:unnamed protein product [Peniophora sp. CBMAI 1063]
MGGGDLNMKKSWHPVLMKNQEKVWLKEKEALEEKKKLDQLRKEKEEERQLQELQRLQEEQTGKKRTEKLEWMYTTPAAGTTTNESELEDYLLGKKRVDKILTADENAKLGAAHKNFIAVQNANNARDIASKIREDPLFAIKQQEAQAYESLMNNPLRLREMQARSGIVPKEKKDKKSKEERKREKKERKEREKAERHGGSHERRRSPNPYERRRSPSPRERHRLPSPHARRDWPDEDRRSSRYDDDRRSSVRYGDDKYARSERDERRPPWPRSDESESPPLRGRSRSPLGRSKRDRSPTRERSPYDSYRKRPRISPPPRRHSPPPRERSGPPSRAAPSNATASRAEADRAARLAAMQGNAASMDVERKERLSAMLEKEKEELAREEAARAKSGGVGSFLSGESRKVFGGHGDLEDRLKRGRAGLVSERY